MTTGNNTSELIDQFFALQAEVHKALGYKEDWRILPMVDDRETYWQIIGSESDGSVRYADKIEDLLDEEAMNYYENEIYTQRHLPKWVYRGEAFTMVCVDTHCDRNQYLQIFSNDREVTFDAEGIKSSEGYQLPADEIPDLVSKIDTIRQFLDKHDLTVTVATYDQYLQQRREELACQLALL